MSIDRESQTINVVDRTGAGQRNSGRSAKVAAIRAAAAAGAFSDRATAGPDFTVHIEVWLRLDQTEIACQVVRPDESTTSLDINSASMRGGQREVAGYLISLGCKPVARWATTHTWDDEPTETMRRFSVPAGVQI